MQRIAIIGLGIIGNAWAKNLHADGLEVRGWNRTPRDFPFFEPDLVKAVTDAEMIIIVVTDPPAVESVLEVIVPHLKPGQLVAQSSTISPASAKLFAQQVEATGAEFLDAPFTGSKPAAAARRMVFYLGGTAELVEKARPVLERLGAHLFHVGELGMGSSLKLSMNLNLALMSQALSESLTLARAQGISDETYFGALHLNAGRSGLSDLKEPKLRTADYSLQFALRHMLKDVRLILDTAGDIDLPMLKTLKSFCEKGIEAGLGDDDFSGLIRLLNPENKKGK